MNITVYVNADGLISVRFPKGVVPDRATLEQVAGIINRYKMQKVA